MSRVIVLGGSGFLGQHVVRLLRKDQHEAIPLSRRDGCDMLDLDGLCRRLREARPEAVINCAAHVGSVQYAVRNAADMIRDNTHLVLNLYEAVRRACPTAKVVNPLSNCSYPGEANTHYEPAWQDGPVHDSVLPYGSTRRMIHAFADSYRKQYGVRTVNWLIANAYGPGDSLDPNRVHALNGIIIRLMQAQRAGHKSFEIWGTGKPIREWVYIEDAARILVTSLSVDEQIYPLNLAQNRAYSITEIAEQVAGILAFPVELKFNTSFVDGAPFKILDDRQFRQKYPDFTFTALDQGIRRTIDHYRAVL
jgi:GDP-L-fucose synthase